MDHGDEGPKEHGVPTGSHTPTRPVPRKLVAASVVHVMALAISTYVAAIEIESIIITGLLCSITGLFLGITALNGHQRVLALVGFLTPTLAAVLTVLESQFLHLGPHGAALPFSIVLLINQAIATTAILLILNRMLAPEGRTRMQVTLRTLLVLMTGFALFSSVAHFLMRREHDWRMLVAMGLMGLTLMGLLGIWYTTVFERRTKTRLEVEEG